MQSTKTYSCALKKPWRSSSLSWWGYIPSTAVPPIYEPSRSRKIIAVIPHSSYVFDEDIGMAESDAHDVGSETVTEEHHADRIDKREVAS